MSTMTDKMSESSKKVLTDKSGVGNPKKGDRYHCDECGMELEVTRDCGCKQASMVHFHCCGQELQKT